jgi:hypothetical protein
LPALTCRSTDLANGDAGASLARGPATTATRGSNVGTYDVTQGALAATGIYTIGTFPQGTLTVDPAGLTVTADNQAMTCGGGVPALTCQHTGPVNGGASAAFTGGLAVTGNYPVATCNGGTPAVHPATLGEEKRKRLPADAGLDRHAEGLRKPHHAGGLGRDRLPPGADFRLRPGGYSEALGPQRAVAGRCRGSLSPRAFLGPPCRSRPAITPASARPAGGRRWACASGPSCSCPASPGTGSCSGARRGRGRDPAGGPCRREGARPQRRGEGRQGPRKRPVPGQGAEGRAGEGARRVDKGRTGEVSNRERGPRATRTAASPG